MILPHPHRIPTLWSRQTAPQRGSEQDEGSRTAIVVVVVIAIVISAVLLTYFILKTIRIRHSTPTYIPTNFLKTRWKAWQPRGLIGSRGMYSARLQNDEADTQTLHARGSHSLQASSHDLAPIPDHAETEQVTDAVDRRTSVRSVITLPTYSKSVRETERILGREGERDGIDTVVEAPETRDEEEERREEEMNSLYQIRQQRRIEIEERNERRDRRREARARGDTAELQRIQEESALAAQRRGQTGAAAMIAEHQSRSRERRVSSVSYGDLGIARHDGSRLRANSNESDRPLLDSAASMSGVSIQPVSTQDSLSAHYRGQSTSSISEMGSDQEFPPFGRAGSDYEVVSLNPTHSRNNSRNYDPSRSRASSNAPSIDTIDARLYPIPLADPPSYDNGGFEEAPPYDSPVEERALPRIQTSVTTTSTEAPSLPDIGRLPSIRIADATPIEPRSTTEFPSNQPSGTT